MVNKDYEVGCEFKDSARRKGKQSSVLSRPDLIRVAVPSVADGLRPGDLSPVTAAETQPAAVAEGAGAMPAAGAGKFGVRSIEMILNPEGEAGPGNSRNSEGSCIELRDGRLFIIWNSLRTGGQDRDVADIKGKISSDGGRTWSAAFVVQPNDARLNVIIASLFRMKPMKIAEYVYKEGTMQGPIGLTYLKEETKYTCSVYFRLSRDEGASWSKEVRINEVPTWANLGARNDTPIVHSSGRIIVPVQASFGDLYGSSAYFSDDEGQTWQRGEDVVVIRERVAGVAVYFSYCEEPAIVELKDGRIMLYGRTMMGRIYRAYSEDRGNMWSDAEPTDLASSYSPCTLKRIPSTGDLICIWNQVSAEEIQAGYSRCRMSCAISKDDGATWGYFKNLESLNNVGRIEPPPLRAPVDATGEAQIIRDRVVARWPAEVKPLDPKRYPKKGYPHVDYPSCSFTSDNHVIIAYSVYHGQDGLVNGNKLLIHPLEWLYES